jgi:hypothetical protein
MSKVRLALRIWTAFLGVVLDTRRRTLPEVVDMLGRPRPARSGKSVHPVALGRAVHRALGGSRVRCVYQALVLYRLLAEQGDDAEVVIGLPAHAGDQRAHAWVEIDGLEVGPPPGRMGHLELARFA